jgi:hypothetical protein
VRREGSRIERGREEGTKKMENQAGEVKGEEEGEGGREKGGGWRVGRGRAYQAEPRTVTVGTIT